MKLNKKEITNQIDKVLKNDAETIESLNDRQLCESILRMHEIGLESLIKVNSKDLHFKHRMRFQTASSMFFRNSQGLDTLVKRHLELLDEISSGKLVRVAKEETTENIQQSKED